MVLDNFPHAHEAMDHAHSIVQIRDVQSRNIGIYHWYIPILDRQMKRARPIFEYQIQLWKNIHCRWVLYRQIFADVDFIAFELILA